MMFFFSFLIWRPVQENTARKLSYDSGRGLARQILYKREDFILPSDKYVPILVDLIKCLHVFRLSYRVRRCHLRYKRILTQGIEHFILSVCEILLSCSC